jgi:hypothetical protein
MCFPGLTLLTRKTGQPFRHEIILSKQSLSIFIEIGDKLMDLNRIMAELDAEISRLQQARRLLAGVPVAVDKDSGTTVMALGSRKRKKMSAAARAKISAAQKKRWAKTKSTKKA